MDLKSIVRLVCTCGLVKRTGEAQPIKSLDFPTRKVTKTSKKLSGTEMGSGLTEMGSGFTSSQNSDILDKNEDG